MTDKQAKAWIAVVLFAATVQVMPHGTLAESPQPQKSAPAGEKSSGPTAQEDNGPGMEHFRRAMIAAKTSTPQEALREFRAAMLADPKNVKFPKELGIFLTQANDLEGARSHYRQTLEAFPEDADLRNDYAVVLMRSAQLDPRNAQDFDRRGREQFQEALRIDPKHADANYNFGLSLFNSGEDVQAEELLRAAVEAKPSYVEAHFNLGRTLLRQRKFEAAIESFEKCKSLNKQFGAAWSHAGQAYFFLKQYDQAIDNLNQWLATSPQDADVRYYIARAMIAQGNELGAIPHLRQVINSRPDSTEAHFRLGQILPQDGQPSAAIAHLETALSQKPDWAGAARQLTMLLAAHPDDSVRDGERALKTAQRARRVAELNVPAALDTLAAAYAAAGRFEDAVRTAQDAIARVEKLKGASAERLAEGIRQRLALYQSGQPYREQPTAANATPAQ